MGSREGKIKIKDLKLSDVTKPASKSSVLKDKHIYGWHQTRAACNTNVEDYKNEYTIGGLYSVCKDIYKEDVKRMKEKEECIKNEEVKGQCAMQDIENKIMTRLNGGEKPVMPSVPGSSNQSNQEALEAAGMLKQQ